MNDIPITTFRRSRGVHIPWVSFSLHARPSVCPERRVMLQGEKRCKMCRKIKPRTEYHRNQRYSDGLATKCKTCRNAANKNRYEENRVAIAIATHKRYIANPQESRRRGREQAFRDQASRRTYYRNWYKKHRSAHRARKAVAHAIERGSLKRQSCEICGCTENIHAHHEDYTNVLEVRWLCGSHHRRLHAHWFSLLETL